MPEYSVIGKPVPRVDARVKVTGQATYAADLILPGMLHGKLLRSPYAHARILNIDASRAERLPGVRAVVTGKDFPGIFFGFVPQTRDQLAMARDKVRHVGEAVAAVAAIDEDTAEEALDLIEVEYEELPPVLTIEEAMRGGAPVIHDRAPNNVAVSAKYHFGDVERGFAESDYVREERFRSQRVAPGFIEPHAILASVDTRGKVIIQASKQSPYITWRHLCRGMGLRLSDVRLINPYVGGAFSGKHDPFDLDFAAVRLAMKTGRPVRIVMSQEEVLASQRQRHSKDIWIKLGVKRDGTLLACDCRLLAEGGAYACVSALNVNVFGRALLMPYRLPNARYEGYRLYTNKPPCGAVRGQANVIARYAFESMLSLVADELCLDQVEIRLRNALRNGDVTANGMMVFDSAFPETFEKVAEAIGWAEKKARKIPYRGIGFGTVMHASGAGGVAGYTSSAAVVQITEDATATVVHGGTEIGQGVDTVAAQIAAEVLGLPMEDITVATEDSEHVILEAGMYGSRGTPGVGNSVYLAADDARRQLAEVAAEMLEVGVEDLEFKDRRVFLKDNPETGVPLLDVVRKAYYNLGQPVYGRGSWTEPRVELPEFKSPGMGGHPNAFSCVSQAIEVEVDPETGKVRVLKSVTCDEMGQPVNPLMLDGQMEGSTMCEVGQTLFEECSYDDQGRPLNTNFLDYKMPTASDAPEFEVYHLVSPSRYHAFGIKACGEYTACTSLPAMVNALCDATGVRFKELPITPPMLLKALKEKEAQP